MLSDAGSIYATRIPVAPVRGGDRLLGRGGDRGSDGGTVEKSEELFFAAHGLNDSGEGRKRCCSGCFEGRGLGEGGGGGGTGLGEGGGGGETVRAEELFQRMFALHGLNGRGE